jgi:hypothetical protein
MPRTAGLFDSLPHEDRTVAEPVQAPAPVEAVVAGEALADEAALPESTEPTESAPSPAEAAAEHVGASAQHEDARKQESGHA